jgi:hypothetical protein
LPGLNFNGWSLLSAQHIITLRFITHRRQLENLLARIVQQPLSSGLRPITPMVIVLGCHQKNGRGWDRPSRI